MKDLLAAKRYAQAIFEIAKASKMDQEVEDELQSFSTALKNSPEFEKFFLNPYFKTVEKEKFLASVYVKTPARKLLLNFFMLLLEKNRFEMIHEVAEIYKRISDLAQGEGLAEIRSAVPLAAKSESDIVSRLEKMTGNKLVVTKEVDASLIGGVIVKIRNQVLDASVKGSLERMKKELTKISN